MECIISRFFDKRTTAESYTKVSPIFTMILKHSLALRSLLAMGIVTLFCGLVYASIQQNFRQNANDPQIQMAEDAAAKLEAGVSVASVIPSAAIDIAQSLSPFIMLFDDTGKPIASSGMLNGIIPPLPVGIFDTVRVNGEDRITWQPQANVRIALIVTKVTGTQSGFVAAGRSLREVEVGENQLTKEVLGAWAIAVVLVGGMMIL